MKGRRQVKGHFFKPWDNWHELCMSAIQRVNGQDNIFKCLWTGYGSTCQVHWFVSRTATLVGFSTTNSFLCVSRTVHHPKNIQPIWHNFVKLWRHGPESLCNAWHLVVRASANWGCSKSKKGGGQLSIRKLFIMFGILLCIRTTIEFYRLTTQPPSASHVHSGSLLPVWLHKAAIEKLHFWSLAIFSSVCTAHCIANFVWPIGRSYTVAANQFLCMQNSHTLMLKIRASCII